MYFTPLEKKDKLGNHLGVELYIKRDDFFPMSGGGNKARKILYIINNAIKNEYDALVTNGSIQSNHARAAAIACATNNLHCKLVLHGDPSKVYHLTGNLLLMKLSTAEIEVVPISQLSEAMDRSILEMRAKGLNPLYVWGGGHCLQGSLAYYDAAKEAQKQCGEWIPDYIVHASGTGTTQAGLSVGFAGSNAKVIGISIAREKERGESIIRESIDELKDYLKLDRPVNIDFRDDWIYGGYEKVNDNIIENIKMAAECEGLILDPTYTGKAFTALVDMIRNGEIPKDSKVLFWHTGGLLNLMASEQFIKMEL